MATVVCRILQNSWVVDKVVGESHKAVSTFCTVPESGCNIASTCSTNQSHFLRDVCEEGLVSQCSTQESQTGILVGHHCTSRTEFESRSDFFYTLIIAQLGGTSWLFTFWLVLHPAHYHSGFVLVIPHGWSEVYITKTLVSGNKIYIHHALREFTDLQVYFSSSLA